MEELLACTACHLRQSATQPCGFKGSPEAKVMFIGEAPGAEEDKQGSPFVGKAGQWLDAALRYLGLTEDQVYITNVVKCRPVAGKSNRTPSKDEMAFCAEKWLAQEIEARQPKVIVLLGSVPFKWATELSPLREVKTIMGTISKYHGRVIFDVPDTCKVFVLFHPAVLVYDRKKYEDLYRQDLKALRDLLIAEGILDQTVVEHTYSNDDLPF